MLEEEEKDEEEEEEGETKVTVSEALKSFHTLRNFIQQNGIEKLYSFSETTEAILHQKMQESKTQAAITDFFSHA